MFFSSNEKKLFSAIKKGDIERIVALLDKVDANFFRKGMTPLMFAAKQGNIKAIEKIIQKGGDLSILDVKSRSPLMYAAFSGNSKVVDILTLANPKIITHRDIDGLTAANHAYVQGYKEIVDKIEDQGFNNRLPLHILDSLREVEVTGTGKDIKNVNIDLKNKTGEPKPGIVLPGTVFHSTDNSQDMVCTEKFDFYLRPNGSFKSRVPVACVDGEKNIPREHNTFRGASYQDSDLIRIVNEMKGCRPNSIQAAVWAYKNHYSAQEIMNKLRRGNAGRTVITQSNIREAKSVLDKLRIYRDL